MDGGGGVLTPITRWLTPPIFFCLLNLMVITIFIRSSFKPKQKNNQEQYIQPPLIKDDNNPVHFFRFPSLLNRVKTFNFSRSIVDEPAERYQHAEPEFKHAERRQHAEPEDEPVSERYQHDEPEFELAERYQHAEPEDEPVERYQHDEPEDEPVEEENEPEEEERHVARAMSDTMEMVVKRQGVRGGVKMMRRSQSVNIVRVVVEEEVEAVERERPATVRERKVNETVPFDEDEAKADDFINRFKQQLKLQRLESFLNYRGASK